MAFTIYPDKMPQLIRQAKQTLRAKNPDYPATFAAMGASVQQEIAEIIALRDAGESVVPELAYADIAAGKITQAQRELIQKRGCVVIRDTFPDELATSWNQQVGRYVEDNGFYETPDKGLDQYFSSLQSGKPQIISVYWSKPQIEARQHENMAVARRFLNRLWQYEHEGEQVFDPDHECSYADRTRRREPGDSSLGLKPHMDGGSVERWLEKDGFHNVYRHLINGNWQDYDPFAAAFRTQTQEIPSPAVCSMFRTFQGWTALTPQGPGDGTLQLIPSARVLGWMFLRALQDDVPEDSLCEAIPGRALQCLPQWHQMVLDGLCSIPHMQPGDTVWWHPDVVHAVEDQHQGDGYSNVIYIGAAPYCEKNVAYLAGQRERFLNGESAPDFAAENYEVDYKGRAGLDDLTVLGKQQMGFL
ncbi:MAG: YbiU family protein [Thiolinea sp.]